MKISLDDKRKKSGNFCKARKFKKKKQKGKVKDGLCLMTNSIIENI